MFTPSADPMKKPEQRSVRPSGTILTLLFAALVTVAPCQARNAPDVSDQASSGQEQSQPATRSSGPADASGFVLLSDAVPDAILEIRYYSTFNFTGTRVDGYQEPVALLTREAAAALRKVSDELVSQGYRLKIFDAYRPRMAVDHFVRWSQDTSDVTMKKYFYPNLDKSMLFPEGYISAKSGHSRGSTVDLTLFDMNLQKEADMGGTFDYLDESSHPDYSKVTKQQYDNRMLLRQVMLKHGFRAAHTEWWHFTLKEEPYPDTYFTFPVATDSIQKPAN